MMSDITQATDEQLLDSFGTTFGHGRTTQSHALVRGEILRRMKAPRLTEEAAERQRKYDESQARKERT